MSDPKPPSGPPAPHVLAGELARVRVAVARAKDDLAQGQMPDLADLQSLVAGVCAAIVRPDGSAVTQDAAQASALEGLLVELDTLENEVRKYRDRVGRPPPAGK